VHAARSDAPGGSTGQVRRCRIGRQSLPEGALFAKAPLSIAFDGKSRPSSGTWRTLISIHVLRSRLTPVHLEPAIGMLIDGTDPFTAAKTSPTP
jgi:hypothetical protein